MDAYRLPDNEISALKRFHKTLRVKREADKVKAVYLLGSGYRVKAVAEILDLDEQTVRNYFLDYKNQDRTKRQWIQLRYTGKESSLTTRQEQELVNHLDENLYQRSQDIILYIKKKYKVQYSPGGVKKLLHRLDFSFKKPKTVPGKFDSHLQELFLRKYRRLLKTKGENDVILFADAVHPTYNLAASYGWIRNNRYDETFSDFTEACKTFFRQRKKWTEELRSRLAQNFHRFNTRCFK